MESLRPPQQQILSPTHFMNTLSSKLRPKLKPSNLKSFFCPFSLTSIPLSQTPSSIPINRVRVRVKVTDAELKENWLASLSSPFSCETEHNNCGGELIRSNVDSDWVIGIDPDLSGALALLKNDELACSAQVFDSPHLQVQVGKRVRRRLDAKSIVQLLRSFDLPTGTTAYIEQSIPFPQDGKQGWWSGGFGYGLWIGILVASGISVVPVPSSLWKNKFELSGSSFTKDDSRRVASTLFPSLSPQLKRKKDHGRAEALLIAAYGKGLKMKDWPCILEEIVP